LLTNLGTIWVGTHGGVYQYDPSADNNGGTMLFNLFPLLPSIDIAGIMEDKNGNIWFATSDKGVFRYNGKTVANFNEKEGLSENYAGGIAQDNSAICGLP
jgi:ligand-binding sensor domain-containing protein